MNPPRRHTRLDELSDRVADLDDQLHEIRDVISFAVGLIRSSRDAHQDEVAALLDLVGRKDQDLWQACNHLLAENRLRQEQVEILLCEAFEGHGALMLAMRQATAPRPKT